MNETLVLVFSYLFVSYYQFKFINFNYLIIIIKKLKPKILIKYLKFYYLFKYFTSNFLE